MATQHTTGFLEKPTRATFIDLEGQRFGRYVVLGLVKTGPNVWLCRCDCGTDKGVYASNLMRGLTRSCGCLRREVHTKHEIVSGMGNSPEADIFRGAKRRCNDPKFKTYENYGGRGIEFLIPSMQAMIDDIGLRPSPDYSLERIDNDGHYEIGNIKWATREEQCRNRRSNRPVTARGKTMLLIDWTKETGIQANAFRQRLKLGWCEECAITIPANGGKCSHVERAKPRRQERMITAKGETKTLSEWLGENRIYSSVFYKRIQKGWCEECAATIPPRGSKCAHIGVTT